MRKNIIKLCFAFALSVLFCSASGQTASEFFELGMRAYKNENFAEAATNFEKSAKLNPTAAAFHNAGNAHVKLSQPGMARLNYERARYIYPRSSETNANLAMIIRNSDDAERTGLADSIFGELSNSEWLSIMIVSFWGGFACLALAPLFLKRARFARLCGGLFIFVFALSTCGVAYWWRQSNIAISVSPNAMLRISPASNAPGIMAVPEGRSVMVRKRNGNYIFAKTASNKNGWANTQEIVPVR